MKRNERDSLKSTSKKLAIITTHPIQYYAPWFCHLSKYTNLDIKVFYLWDFGVTHQIDSGFQQSLKWDIPLLEDYDYEFIPNTSKNPGTSHFGGLQNPLLLEQVKACNPNAVLLMAYNYSSLYRFIWSWDTTTIPLLFRGDSHRLLPASGFKAWLKRQWISQIYRRFSACLYVGKANYEYFRYHQVSTERLFFSPHAIDQDRFVGHAEAAKQQAIAWKDELGIPKSHSVILFSGKFETKKCPLDLLQAFVRANLEHVALLFIGAGYLETELKRASDQHPNIFIAPFQNQSLMPRTYAIADLVVLPSYGSGETWGLVINEAMCMGKPVIVSSHVGCAQDLVHPYSNGLIFPAGDISALTECLKIALSDPLQLNQWGKQSRKIIANYSYAHTTEGLLNALNYILPSM